MQRRCLGATGISVSDPALGTMNFGWWGNADRAETIGMIHAALDAGINFIDTADVYQRLSICASSCPHPRTCRSRARLVRGGRAALVT
jgi:diketogulonate reductase-like aldo/keto reductase